jgi:hypothetical protein
VISRPDGHAEALRHHPSCVCAVSDKGRHTRRVRRGDNCPGRYGSEPTINDDGAKPFLPDMRWSGVTFLRIVR